MAVISVIIPIYNAEKYIRQCLNSVINQTYKDIEIICIDDGSVDATPTILDEYAQMDMRIKVIHKINEGLAAARKDGIALACGKYIAFVDSDDWVSPYMYEKMYSYAQEHDVDAVSCGFYSVKNNSCFEVLPGIKSGIYRDEGNSTIVEQMYSIEKAKNIINWNYWTYLFKKEKIYSYVMNVPSVEQGEDMVAIWSFLVNAKKIYIINEALYYYRVSEGSSCRKENPFFLTNMNKVYLQLKKEFEDKSRSDYLLKMLKNAMFNSIQTGICFTSERQDFFMFPYELIPFKAKIVLYGAGMVGKSYYRQIRENSFCNIVLWVDEAFKRIANDKYAVSDPEQIKLREFDYLLVAITDYMAAKSLAIEIAEKYCVVESKIVTCEPKRLSKFVDL